MKINSNHVVFESYFHPSDGSDGLVSMCGTYGGGAARTAALKVQEAGPFDPGYYAVVSYPETMDLEDVYESDGKDGYRISEAARHLVTVSRFRLRRRF